MPDVKIATWNINSVRLRIDQVRRFVEEERPDVLALQEIKCLEEQFPFQAFKDMGFDYTEVSGQKGYHGAATVSRFPMQRLDTDFCPRSEARHVSTKINVNENGTSNNARDFELHNFYVPAGGDDADIKSNPKFAHKMEFLDRMKDYFKERFTQGDQQQVIVGDLNIAPGEHDVWGHKQLLKVVSHTPIEVASLTELMQTHDFIDTARLYIPEDEKVFSWWSYRSRDINKSDRGRRLDHIWVSPALENAARNSGAQGFKVHKACRFWERPSDHAPVTQILSL